MGQEGANSGRGGILWQMIGYSAVFQMPPVYQGAFFVFVEGAAGSEEPPAPAIAVQFN